MRSLIPYLIGFAIGCKSKPVEPPRRETTVTHGVTLNGFRYTTQDCDKDGVVDLVRYGTEHEGSTAYVRDSFDLKKLRCPGIKVRQILPMSLGIGLAANRAHFALDDLELAVRQAEFKISSGDKK